MAGMSFSLAAVTEELRPLDDDPVVARARTKVTAAAAGARRNVGELRTLISEIYPPDLEAIGLATALGDLLAPLESAGIATGLNVPPVVAASARNHHGDRAAREGGRTRGPAEAKR